ncbi:hypothetical protein GGG16DRAFT_103930 [Schizophyllum commune]
MRYKSWARDAYVAKKLRLTRPDQGSEHLNPLGALIRPHKGKREFPTKGTPAVILVQMATFGNTCDKEQIDAALRPFVVRVRDVNSHHHDVSGPVLVDGMDCHENQWMIMLPVAVSLDALLPCEGTRGKIPVIAKASRTNFAEGVYEKYANLVRTLRADPNLAKQVYFDVHHRHMDQPYIPRPGFAYERCLLPSLGSIATFTSHLDLEARKALNWWALTKPLAKKPNVAVLLMTEFELLKILLLSKNDFARAVALRGLRLLPNRVLGRRPVKGPSHDGNPCISSRGPPPLALLRFSAVNVGRHWLSMPGDDSRLANTASSQSGDPKLCSLRAAELNLSYGWVLILFSFS